MRIPVYGLTKLDCVKTVNRKMKDGWEPVSKITEDTSQVKFGYLRYVCVMERKDTLHQKQTNQGRNFNHGGGKL